ncbi:MAG: glycosyltransferase [Promethearchaeota archaeon]
MIIPCWNEEKYIGQCLESIIASDYPKEMLEVLVVDGMSNDKTQEIVKIFAF